MKHQLSKEKVTKFIHGNYRLERIQGIVEDETFIQDRPEDGDRVTSKFEGDWLHGPCSMLNDDMEVVHYGDLLYGRKHGKWMENGVPTFYTNGEVVEEEIPEEKLVTKQLVYYNEVPYEYRGTVEDGVFTGPCPIGKDSNIRFSCSIFNDKIHGKLKHTCGQETLSIMDVRAGVVHGIKLGFYKGIVSEREEWSSGDKHGVSISYSGIGYNQDIKEIDYYYDGVKIGESRLTYSRCGSLVTFTDDPGGQPTFMSDEALREIYVEGSLVLRGDPDESLKKIKKLRKAYRTNKEIRSEYNRMTFDIEVGDGDKVELLALNKIQSLLTPVQIELLRDYPFKIVEETDNKSRLIGFLARVLSINTIKVKGLSLFALNDNKFNVSFNLRGNIEEAIEKCNELY